MDWKSGYQRRLRLSDPQVYHKAAGTDRRSIRHYLLLRWEQGGTAIINNLRWLWNPNQTIYICSKQSKNIGNKKFRTSGGSKPFDVRKVTDLILYRPPDISQQPRIVANTFGSFLFQTHYKSTILEFLKHSVTNGRLLSPFFHRV